MSLYQTSNRHAEPLEVPGESKPGTACAHRPRRVAALAKSKRIARFAREVSGLSQAQLGAAILTSRGHTKHFEDDDAPQTPTLVHLLLAPDRYLDPLLQQFAAARADMGKAAREWVAVESAGVETLPKLAQAEALSAQLDAARLLASCPIDDAGEEQLKLFERVTLRCISSTKAVNGEVRRVLWKLRGGR